MRSMEFSKRTTKEILRDPLSYIFCLGFPIIMLIIMTVVDRSIPKEAQMDIFKIHSLAPGMAVFGLSFVMLFTCIQISKDRTTAFLTRLYASPMRSVDFIVGYTLPSIVLALIQVMITYICSFIVAAVIGGDLKLSNMLLSVVCLLPSILLYIGFGLLFGSLLNDKAAPGICSIVITLSCMIGGIWMDVDAMGGGIKQLSECLPFYHGVRLVRKAVSGDMDGITKSLIIILLYATVVYILAVVVMRGKMKKDVR
ncbi:MAG: ABC transporter permease [Clostridium sp.]|nr:ABC transporter permease [Clostridium sp.]MCM1399673.1 ABC transporter permease [Clostridium sp.]MCM1460533.1 ABC transporter permease [Bacteroides sp.]